MQIDELDSPYDVIVIGGGAAGLSGALMLTRSRRSVLVIDQGRPRNAPAAGVHGLLGHDGMPPAELLDRGRTEVRSYGGTVIAATVSGASRAGGVFTVALEDGRVATARRLLVTTGLIDELPAVRGLAERWGQDVIHCPYCHGWEVRDQPIGILATGPMAVHQALLFRQLSDDVLVFSHTSVLADDDRARLAVRQVRVVEGEVAELQVAAGRLAAVALTDGRLVPRQVLAVQSRMVARAAFLADLGLGPVDHPMGVGSYVPADPTGLSEVPGVYLAGNVTDLTAQVGAAAAAGALAGARINADLVDEETETALRTRQKTSVAITDASAGLLEAH